MNKIIAALIAATFSFGAFAQAASAPARDGATTANEVKADKPAAESKAHKKAHKKAKSAKKAASAA